MSGFASIVQGSETWSAHCKLPRHRHEQAYAAVILSGGYEEGGSHGRYRVRSGHVLLHRRFDAHLDRFESSGARVLNLLLKEQPVFGLGMVADPDVIARVAEKDAAAAVEAMREQMTSSEPQPADWPDLLARDLLDDPQLRLDEWAERHHLAPASLSRGFRTIFRDLARRLPCRVADAECPRADWRGHGDTRGDCRGCGLCRSSPHDARGSCAHRPAARPLAQVKWDQDTARSLKCPQRSRS